MKISNEEFDRYVRQALETVAPEFRCHFDQVPVIVEDLPDDDLSRKLHLADGRSLLGLFQGVPLHKTSHPAPSQITLYRRNILAHCHNHNQLIRQIRKTVIHELGHYLGFSEQQLRRHKY